MMPLQRQFELVIILCRLSILPSEHLVGVCSYVLDWVCSCSITFHSFLLIVAYTLRNNVVIKGNLNIDVAFRLILTLQTELQVVQLHNCDMNPLHTRTVYHIFGSSGLLLTSLLRSQSTLIV